MTTGERIKHLREFNKLTQEELASLTNSTKQTIYKYENDIIMNIPYSKIEKIADALHVAPAYLMGWEDGDSTSEKSLFKATIAERLCEALSLRSMKQSDLIKKTGISRSSINNYMYGKFEPKYDNIQKMAKALDVSENWLTGYDVPMNQSDSSEFGSEQVYEMKNIESNNYKNFKDCIINNFGVGRLNEALSIRGIKISDLVKKTGIERDSIESCLRGYSILCTADIRKIAKVLDVSDDWLQGYNVTMDGLDIINEDITLRNSKVAIAGRLYEALSQKDMTITDFINKTGINSFTINNYMFGKSEPNYEDIKKMAKVLNVNEAWLCGYDFYELNPSEIETKQKYESINTISKNDRTLQENIINKYGEYAFKLLENYDKLNELGKSEAYKRIEELTYLDRYSVLED